MSPLLPQHPVRYDHLQSCCDHIFWCNATPLINYSFHGGDVVYCKIDKVLDFFNRLRLTRKRVVLITGESDYPCDALRQQFLPANVIAWFSPNVTHPHPRVHAIPLGIGMPNDIVTLQVDDLLENSSLETAKKQWLYVNFRPDTNPSIRQKIYDHFLALASEPWVTFDPPSPRGDNCHFLHQLKRHHFILCPPGNGVDTHRMWEALVAGTYPIVLRSPAIEPFEALPILFVNTFEEVTLDFLRANLKQLQEKEKNNFMLHIPFWQEKIKASKATLQGHEMMPWSTWLTESLCYGLSMLKRRLFSQHV